MLPHDVLEKCHRSIYASATLRIIPLQKRRLNIPLAWDVQG